MKTLILQLARLGDLWQSWPAARALRRVSPGAEIHLLARPRFAAACERLSAVDRIVELPTRDLLEPLLRDRPDVDEAVARMSAFEERLRGEGYDRVINLSFSPLSSRLARAAARGSLASASGYSRHADATLAIPDDPSAYFFAQAGPGRSNKIHLTDLFAAVAGVDLVEGDWASPFATRAGDTGRVAIHVGASDGRKTLSPNKWASVARSLLRRPGMEISLVGSTGERACANSILEAIGDGARVRNLVGRTSVRELAEEIAGARLLIGGDSGPMQIASLAGTPALCISLPWVSFWETGPRAKGSRVIAVGDEDEIGSDAIADEAERLLEGRPSSRAIVESDGPLAPYRANVAGAAFEWRLLQAMYMDGAFPPAPDAAFSLACLRARDANDIAIEQLAILAARPRDANASAIFERAGEIIVAVGRIDPRFAIVARWLDAERLRVAPGPTTDVVRSYLRIHALLRDVLRAYQPDERTDERTDGARAPEKGSDAL